MSSASIFAPRREQLHRDHEAGERDIDDQRIACVEALRVRVGARQESLHRVLHPVFRYSLMIRHRYGGLADDVAGNEHRAQNPWSPWWPS
jgi:hypothetical protein